MRRMLWSVVILGIITIGMMGGAAWYLASSDPKLKLKVQIEKAVPVRVERLAPVEDARGRRLQVHARPRPGDRATPELAARLAEATAETLESAGREGPALHAMTTAPYDAIEAHLEGVPAYTLNLLDRHRRLAVERELPDIVRRLKLEKQLGAAPRLSIVPDDRNPNDYCLLLELPAPKPGAEPPTEAALRSYATAAFRAGYTYASVKIVGPGVPSPGFTARR